ncbi:MAG: tubulin/FtsZ family protein [Halobacteriales archaeon]|nr:tubulin/FtsZ family protein [Halobacteriales archaeon]
MKVALIGVGQAGGKLAEALSCDPLAADSVVGSLAINSARADLSSIGLDTLLIGAERVNGHGVGGDNELGATVMQEDTNEVVDAVASRVGSDCEAIVITAGLGGGTGSGGAPVLVHELKRIYDVPVYVLGVLPGRDEGALYQRNAGRSLKTLAREADATILVDNDAWRQAGESVDEGYAAVNEKIAQRMGLLLAAGEFDASNVTAESVVDSSEVINTLRNGSLAAIGYASAESSPDADANLNTITSVARNALLTGTSLPNATTAESALLIVAGEADRINRKGVEAARTWLEDELGSMQVRGGDYPLDSEQLAALVLLGGVERSERVQAFLDRASEANVEAEKPDATESLTSDELDGLF